MMIIDTGLSGIVAGYDKIREYDYRLQHRWRDWLLAVHAHRQEVCEKARSNHQRKLDSLKPWAVGVLVLSALAFVLGVVSALPDEALRSLPPSGWPLPRLAAWLMPLGLLGGLVVGLVWYAYGRRGLPAASTHPFQEPLRSRLFAALAQPWYAKLKGQLPARMADDGAIGEARFVSSLQALKDFGFIIYRLRQQQGDDVDVVVLGTKGIWVFEVKYWSGTIRWRSGQWSRERAYFTPRGVPNTETLEVRQPPDQQWQRMADDVMQTLQRRAPDVAATVAAAGGCRGGMVFTHDKASYDIPATLPVAWGDVAAWRVRLGAAPVLPGLDGRTLLQAADALLDRHHEFTAGEGLVNMDEYAAELIREAETRLTTWMHGG